MKKIISILLSLLLLTCVIGTPSVSATVESNEYFDDGSFISIGYGSPEDWESTDSEEESRPTDVISFIKRIINFIRDFFEKMFGENKSEIENKVQTTSRTKYAAYYDSKGTLLWTVYLHGRFTFDGEKSECISSSVSSEIRDSDWKVISAVGYYEGTKAKGDFTVQQYKLGIKLKTVERTLTLTCDKNGKVY